MNQSPLEVFCSLLHSALEREEKEIHQIRIDKKISDSHGPPENFLASVVYAPEVAIGYLVRKQALRDRIPLETEVECEGRKGHVDLCLVGDGGAYIASLELKPPHELFVEKTHSLRSDVERGFDRSVRGVDLSQQYYGWLLITSERKDALKNSVQRMLNGIADLVECLISEAMSINSDSQHRYKDKSLYAVVFSTKAQAERVATSTAR